MSHFNLNITEIPVYNDGSFLLYKLKQANEVFPYEQIEKLYDEPFFYEELSLTDNILFENDKMQRKIVKKIRIPQDKEITSINVLKINNLFYQVFNIYHFKNKDGYLQSDITLQEYINPNIVEEKLWLKKN